MIGQKPTVNDIELDLQSLVIPDNLMCSESLSPDCEGEEVEHTPYRVDTSCHSCGTGVRLCVYSTGSAIRQLQELLISELNLFCPPCARNLFHHGRN
uniref:Protein E7 n=1 Tax=Human papillomavirus TaxID=10566 RepID=A0A385PKF9_9PAPI|nr:MAG: E7 protein [Human papillomavirus]